ncbi:MAG: putative membrane-bound dehydrogenase-like protein [Arcticibacterium sp.]|jgi:putative membrane-bound dehydrogenase-like protein
MPVQQDNQALVFLIRMRNHRTANSEYDKPTLKEIYMSYIQYPKAFNPIKMLKRTFLLIGLSIILISQNVISQEPVDREYALEASMLGYFAKDGTRNPTLKANKGDRVKITITNTETMTHDIAMEKLNIKSNTLSEKGSSTSISFTAKESDTYFCTVPGHRAAGMIGRFEVVEGDLSDPVVPGIKPTKNGEVLNLGFEAGSLNNWKASGDAFTKPLNENDLKTLYKDESVIGHDGNFFISSGGKTNHQWKGELVSEPFEVIHPYASFLVSGGALQDTRVELVAAATGEVIYQTTGQGRATLQPVVADLRPFAQQNIFIRIIDNETGISPISYIGQDKWAHINFDNFLFHPSRPYLPNELDQQDIIILPPLDPVANSGLSGIEAARAMSLPEGFKITLAANEPEVVRPISFTIDAKGRLWIVEGHTYPTPAPEGEGKDRILIFEDTNGDGTLDKRKVFAEGLNLVSGIEVGMGGVWLGAAPYLLFIPINPKNDMPAGAPQRLLDGWGTHDTHEVLNNLRWGPDGWLYGVHGIFTHSNVGKVGATDAERTKMNGGVWRYHPTRHEFEVFAHGTSNPWGVDFNDYGHAFATVCVIPHMFHIIQGARYERQANKHFNPYTYDDIKNIGDHVHWLGDRGPHAGNFRSAVAGGGHAHAGAMIYLGDSWPAKYRNEIFMNNIHGAKLNVDHLTPKGSGYVASHEADFLSMNDSWSQWLNMKYDASGSVWAIDWYDQNQCHSPNPDVHDKTLGRIFKITHENDKWVQVDLTQATDLELVKYQLHANEWYVRQARTLLQARGGSPEVHTALKVILVNNPDITRKLRALWTLHVTDGLSESELKALLQNESEYIRSWAIQLLTEKKSVFEKTLQAFEKLAKNEPSPMVRLYLISGIQRLKPTERWGVLSELVQKLEDVEDQNIPLMLWYASEPLAELDAERALTMVEKSPFPNLLTYMIKRVGAINTPASKQALKNISTK